MTVFSMYSGILPSKEEMAICLDGIISWETNTYSLPETFAGREAVVPRAAHAGPEAAQPVQSKARAARTARSNPFSPGSLWQHSKVCTCMEEKASPVLPSLSLL